MLQYEKGRGWNILVDRNGEGMYPVALVYETVPVAEGRQRAQRYDRTEQRVVNPICACCGCQAGPLFMVHDALWQSVVNDPHAIWCFACFQQRLGRYIMLADLKPCPITDGMKLGLQIAAQSLHNS
jgi:hypothetical protein